MNYERYLTESLQEDTPAGNTAFKLTKKRFEAFTADALRQARLAGGADENIGPQLDSFADRLWGCLKRTNFNFFTFPSRPILDDPNTLIHPLVERAPSGYFLELALYPVYHCEVYKKSRHFLNALLQLDETTEPIPGIRATLLYGRPEIIIDFTGPCSLHYSSGYFSGKFCMDQYSVIKADRLPILTKINKEITTEEIDEARPQLINLINEFANNLFSDQGTASELNDVVTGLKRLDDALVDRADAEEFDI